MAINQHSTHSRDLHLGEDVSKFQSVHRNMVDWEIRSCYVYILSYRIPLILITLPRLLVAIKHKSCLKCSRNLILIFDIHFILLPKHTFDHDARENSCGLKFSRRHFSSLLHSRKAAQIKFRFPKSETVIQFNLYFSEKDLISPQNKLNPFIMQEEMWSEIRVSLVRTWLSPDAK